MRCSDSVMSARAWMVVICLFLLICAGIVAPAQGQTATLGASTLSVSPTFVGNSASSSVALTNSGTTAMTISSIATGGTTFTQSNTCGSELAAGTHCIITVTFAPTATGAQTDTLTIVDNAPGSPHLVNLKGSGLAPAHASVASVTFARQAVSTTSAPTVVTITNGETTALGITGIAVTGDFAQTNDCPAFMPGSSTCAVNVTFNPTATGTLRGSLTIGTGAGYSFSVGLTGTGIAPYTVTPVSLAFGNQATGTSSVSKTVTVTNAKNVALGISNIAISSGFVQTNNCSSVPANSSCTFSVAYAPAATGNATGSLSFTLDNPAATQTIILTGTGLVPYSATPTGLIFTNQATGTISAAKTVTVINRQTVALTISDVAISAGFAQTNNCSSVAANGSCSFSVTFAPTAVGSAKGTLTFEASNGVSPQTISLSGSGTVPFTVTPGTLAFGNQASGTTSLVKTVTLTNRQSEALAISDVSVSAGFAQTNTCGSSLPAGTACTFSVNFVPTTTGSMTGSLTFATGNGSPLPINLTGTGIAPYTISAASLVFGFQASGTSSAAKILTVTNRQNVALQISDVNVSAGFAQTNNCDSVAPNASCSISVTFAPATTGVMTGSLTFAASNGGAKTISLSGTATVPFTVSAATLAFGNQATGMSSAAKTVTVANKQNATLQISDVNVSAGFLQTNNCANIAVNGSCNISVTFEPAALGNATGSLTFTPSNGDPQTINLTGTGIAPVVIAPAAISFSPLAAGMVGAPTAITVRNNQNVPLGITGLAATANFQQTNTCGSSVPALSSCTISVSFAPAALGALTGTLTISDDAASLPQTMVSLKGTALPSMSLSAASLSFGSLVPGGATATQDILVKNSTTADFSLTGISVTGDYSQTNNCPALLTAGTNCTVSVVFAPTTTGARNGTLTVTDSSVSSPLTARLVGSGIKLLTSIALNTTAGYDTINPPPRNPAISLGLSAQYSAMGTFNDGTTQDISASVAWGSSDPTVVSISSTGLAQSVKQGEVTITATSGSIQGSGILEVFPPAVTSVTVTPATPVLVLGAGLQFTLTANYTDGSTSTGGASWSASGGLSIDGSGLATATSTGLGTVTGTVQNCPPAGCGPVSQTIQVAVVSNSIAASPTSLDFGLQHKGSASGAQTVQLSNGASSPLAIQISASSGYQTTDNCGGSIAANGSCSVNVIFAPAAGGSGNVTDAGALTITPNAGTVASVGLAGVGTDSTPPCSTPTVDMKLLVISKGQTEVELGGIKQILDYLGTPYTIFDFQSQAGGITADMLSDGACHGYYQGVIFTLGDYIYSLPGMSTLTTYEQNFAIRQVNWYTFPNPDFGFGVATAGTGDPENGNFTQAGTTVFPYVNTANALSITGGWTYLAPSGNPQTGTSTTLMFDDNQNALSAVYDFGDGRQYLTQTFDTNSQLTHGLVLAYGLINWVTKGTFLGEYHVYSVPQVDDIFMHNDEYESTTPCPNSDPLPQFRLSASDWDNVVAWQNAQQQNPQFANWTLQMAFVGSGATGIPGDGYGVSPDDLTPEVELYKSDFNWISHTWDHTHLDDVSAAQTDAELLQNNAMAGTLGLPNYNPALLVTPAITGLNNPDFINEAVADGVQVIVTDTTVLNTPNNGPNPSPNVGIVNSFNSGMYEVPRHATNLFYNVGTPDDWTTEYQCIYDFSPYSSYTYQNILDNVSQTLLYDMLTGDMDPQMFHESNLHDYDGNGHALMFDLYNETFTNYMGLVKLPVLSPTLDVLAQNMQNRNAYNLSGVLGSLTTGSTSSISISVPAGSAVPSATIPVTGVSGEGAEVYGGVTISHPVVNAGQTVTLPLQ
jgi:Abnormal spindle-like microcephaly-assoc'd, ASPM-SPD-2-Hydin/Bacterial Ig-like domain (group 2)/Cep192 domain 4